MSLADLDRFLARRDIDPELALQLAAPMDLDQFLALALRHGFTLTEADVFAAQQREVVQQSAETLQKQQASESRRLRHFIHG